MGMLPPLLGIYDLEVRDFLFYPYDPRPEIKKFEDKRVSAPIKDLLENYFFTSPDRVLVYICDSSEGALGAEARQKLFYRWYKTMQHIFERHEVEAISERTGEVVHGGVVTRRDFRHPDILQNELLDKVPDIAREKFGM
jgi:hypothetical protein